MGRWYSRSSAASKDVWSRLRGLVANRPSAKCDFRLPREERPSQGGESDMREREGGGSIKLQACDRGGPTLFER